MESLQLVPKMIFAGLVRSRVYQLTWGIKCDEMCGSGCVRRVRDAILPSTGEISN